MPKNYIRKKNLFFAKNFENRKKITSTDENPKTSNTENNSNINKVDPKLALGTNYDSLNKKYLNVTVMVSIIVDMHGALFCNN